MRYDLRALARARGIRRKGITFRPIDPTAVLAGELDAIARDIIAAAETEIRESLLPVYEPRPSITQDDAANGIANALAGVGSAMSRLVLGIGPKVRNWATKVEGWHRPKFAAGVKAGTGADIAANLQSADAGDQVRASADWAASLIQGLTDDLRKKVADLTWGAYANQTPRAELAAQLQAVLNISRKRADFIARDQTTKLAANLDRLRQQEAGIAEYKWRHSGKVHFRPEHLAREGKIFRWDTPPPGGHPGTEPNCGCRAQAYVNLDD
ncbi:hypothetical protein MEX01_48390 [Methylorubrum extorquens]|uniref:phage head morphogenesis protein n=1 Tax=Methylorubrum extorquens TaxID=408 RepID=UPI0011716006|nr:minor capsid protein [Methylorubrum extorquens]GEL44248.1 hypothetical protein MEX01_48390 [Methylorubrum extorquens]